MKREQKLTESSIAAGENLKDRYSRALGVAGLALMLGIASHGVVHAESAPVALPDNSFPESLTSTRDGTIYAGSFNLGGVVKVAPGGKAEPFIKPGAAGSRSVLGVLADENSGTLYVCSNDITGFGVPGPSDTKGAWLKTFDLKSGAAKGSFALQDPKSLCNDIAVGADGTAYVTELVRALCVQPEARWQRARDLGDGPEIGAGEGWRRPRRHRGRFRRQSVCHDVHPGIAAQDNRRERQGRGRHRAEGLAPAGPRRCHCVRSATASC